MGDPKKQRKKFQTPHILWNKERIELEKEILKDYGLKNKTEIWKLSSLLRKFTSDAKKLIVASSEQAKLEEAHLLKKLKSYGLLQENARVDEILGLQLKDILERRLQTIVFKQGLARSVKQARQLIVHQHISVGDDLMTSPSYLVPVAMQDKIHFCSSSALANQDHPERSIVKTAEPQPKKPKPRNKRMRK